MGIVAGSAGFPILGLISLIMIGFENPSFVGVGIASLVSLGVAIIAALALLPVSFELESRARNKIFKESPKMSDYMKTVVCKDVVFF